MRLCTVQLYTKNPEYRALLQILERLQNSRPDWLDDDTVYSGSFNYCLNELLRRQYAGRLRTLAKDVKTDSEPPAGARPGNAADEPLFMQLIRDVYDIPREITRVADIPPTARFRAGINGRSPQHKQLEDAAVGQYTATYEAFLPVAAVLGDVFDRAYSKYRQDGDGRTLLLDPTHVPEYKEAYRKILPRPFNPNPQDVSRNDFDLTKCLTVEEAIEHARGVAKPGDLALLEKMWHIAQQAQMGALIDVKAYDRVLSRVVHTARLADNLDRLAGEVEQYCDVRRQKYPIPPPELVVPAASVRGSNEHTRAGAGANDRQTTSQKTPAPHGHGAYEA